MAPRADIRSEAARTRDWRYKGETWQLIRSARPNPGHEALARLARADRLELLVTQNVDVYTPGTPGLSTHR